MDSFAYNTTTSGGLASMATIGNWLPTMGILIVSSIIIGVLLIAVNESWFKRFFKLFGYIGNTVFYAVKGGLTIAAGYVIYLVGNFIGSVGGSIPSEYYIYGIFGFAGLAMLGWFDGKIYTRIKLNYTKAKK